jgi:nitrate/nitrite transporter NarK/N-acetylneuraminic acid mutarotase
MGIDPSPNRWTIVAAAAVVMLTIGTIYSWAIFTQPLLVAYRWDLTTTTWAYAIANFCLAAVGAVIGGFWQDRVGPRTVTMVGVTLWASGNVVAGLGTSAFGAPWLYVSYGIIGGIGAGMAYITPLSMVTKWFPDKKGLTGGLVTGAFGLGAFVYNQWIPRLPGFHAAAVHAGAFITARTAATAAGARFDPRTLTVAQTFSADDIRAVTHVLIGSGIVFLIVGLAAASLFRNPPAGYSSPGRPRTATPCANDGYSPSQVIAMPQFYLLWLQLLVNVIAGITIISNAVFMLADLTKVSAASIAPLFGLVTIFNALGRCLWGAISDRIGCNHTFAAMFAVQAVTVMVLANVHELMPALTAVSVILLCCGGGFGTMPSFNAACFGTKFMGLNYGLILSAWGFAALIGPIIVARAKDLTGSFAGVLPLIAIVLAVSVIMPYITKKPAAASGTATEPVARVRARSGPERALRAARRGLAALVLVTLTAGFGSCGGGGNVPSYMLGGSVSGLLPGHSVVLQNHGSDSTTVSANTTFTFGTAITYQSPYAVTVATQPAGESCAVTNSSGTMPATNVSNVTVLCTTMLANAGSWTWESGSDSTATSFTGVYGTQGTAAPGNVPGGREAAFSWSDGAGNLWIFGGIGAGNSGVGGSFNDLWRYSPGTGLWVWMSGAETLDALSVYGTKGTAAAGNVPSAREGGAAWTDGAGNFWLFGGGGLDSAGSNGALNDLWEYSPGTGLWSWMGGPTMGNLGGVYGTEGTAAPANVPGARSGVVSWKDGAGNFWLFGGGGFDSSDSDGYLNDLWRYSPGTGMWTWMGGSTQENAAGVYGTQGTSATGNIPGARFGAVSWTDGTGNFWLFGGYGHDSMGNVGALNDLWQYSPSTAQWTWMSGSMLQGAPGVYGTQGTPAAGNVPGAREDAASWIDSAGNLWLFGDGVFDSNGKLVSVGNDLWRYAPSTGLWTWMGGSMAQGAVGVYGTLGVAAAGNVPGGRDIGLSWTDGAGNFWLFGGYVPFAALNDLWKYVPPVP